MMATVTFLPQGVAAPCANGESIFEVGRRHSVPIATSCVGQGTCGRCRVTVLGGEEFLSEFTQAEAKHLGNVYFLTKVRLSCQAIVQGGDVTVEVPAPRQAGRKTR
jgi:ferredoxin, 2Fe-2S